jgi:hypothetical protein
VKIVVSQNNNSDKNIENNHHIEMNKEKKTDKKSKKENLEKQSGICPTPDYWSVCKFL